MTLLRKTQGHASSGLLCIGACLPDRTGLTELFGKEDLDDSIPLSVSVQVPGAALLPLRADDPLLLPVDLEVFDIQCSRSASLPTGIAMDWPHHINPVVFSTVQDPLSADITSIDELLGRKKRFDRSIRLDGNESMMILFNRWHGFDLGDEMGKVITTAFRQMHFVSHLLE
jgi:hypothetical protein